MSNKHTQSKPAIQTTQKAVPFPEFQGKVYKRPSNYQQQVGSNAILDEYTIHAYQYATSSRPGFCTPSAIIYAAQENDILLAIQYARDTNIAIAVRSGGHMFWGFSSTSGENIQVDMSDFNRFDYDEDSQTFTVGAGVKLFQVDAKLREVGAFIPHGQCGTVAMGGHLQSGGFSVLCGRSFGWFCDRAVSFKLITADVDQPIRIVVRPDPENPNPENDELWFASIGGSPGNFGIVTEITMRPLFDADYPQSRSMTKYLPYSKEALQGLIQIVADFNDNDDLPADYNITAFILGRSFWDRPNIDVKMMKEYPEIYGGDPGQHPYIIGLWATYCNLDGGDEYPKEAQQFFTELEERVEEVESFLDKAVLKFLEVFVEMIEKFGGHTQVPFISPDEPLSMSELTSLYSFPMRVHHNPYVSATWCGQSTNISNNGFAEWAADITDEVQQQPGTFADFEWVACGGKHSKNITNAMINPTAVAWRNTTILLFQYVHFEITSIFGRDWPEPGNFARDWVQKVHSKAIEFLGGDHRWNAFPYQDDDLDKNRQHYFDSRETYDRVLSVKRKIDPTNVFTPNNFCIGATRNE